MNDYTGRLYRKLRQQFRDDCRRNRRPCIICRNAIDYDLRHGHQWAWELHHLKPSSLHPHLHMVRTNWAPSHARCNKAQGNKPHQDWVAPSW